MTAPALAKSSSVFFELLEEVCGLKLNESKRNRLLTPMKSRCDALGLSGMAALGDHLRKLPLSHPEWLHIFEIVTTHKTSFFREADHFQFIVDVFLPVWEKQGNKKLEIWSAGTSTGEEAYTLAMVLDRYLKGRCDFHILATDIDLDCLEIARRGVYPKKKLEEVPQAYHQDYFMMGSGEIAEWVSIHPSLKAHITFQEHNLTDLPYKWPNRFQLILCRNVLMYLTEVWTKKVLRALFDSTGDNGYFFVGHSETFHDKDLPWKYVQPSTFEKNPAYKVSEASAPARETSSRPTRLVSVPQYSRTAPTGKPRPVAAFPTPTTASAEAQTSAENQSSVSTKIRVLIVDDSKTIRKMLSDIFSRDPRIEVVGLASNPIEAETLIPLVHPDVMTLDLMMPFMDGVTFLKKLLPVKPIPVVVISSLGLDEGVQVIRALELGAVDYFQKPALSEFFRQAPSICQKIRMAAVAKVRGQAVDVASAPLITAHQNTSRKFDHTMVILIGASTGGTEAIREILIQFPRQVPPIVIVQHLPVMFSTAFAQRLNDVCPFGVREAVDKEKLEPGRAYVAPGGMHTGVVSRPDGGCSIALLDAEPINHHKPSIDHLFESAAFLGSRALGVLLTGMGSDGAKGLLGLRMRGSHTVVQDEESCVVFGMPKEAIRLGAAERVASLNEIPEAIMHWIEKN